MMALILIIIGILLLLLAVLIFRKLPGIRLKYVRIIMLAGFLLLVAGAVWSLIKPVKGLLSAGDAADKGNNDVAGIYAEAGESEITDGTVIVDGKSIIIDGNIMLSTREFNEYIAGSERQGGYRIIDRYALYDTYKEVLEILEKNGKIIEEERAVE